MRKSVLLSVICAVSFFGLAQETGNEFDISFDNLEVPDAPAFILLDAAPSVVQRPNSSRAFGLSLLQDIASDGTLNNFAVEVTPFWMTRHENITPFKLYGVDTNKKQNPFAKLKLASVSAAYVKGADSVVNVSIGARATVFELKRQSDVDDYFAMYKKTEDLLYELQDFLDEFEDSNPKPKRSDPDYETALKTWQTERADFVNQKQQEAGHNRDTFEKDFQEILNRKPALALDVAVAYNQRFAQNTFNANGFGRFGVWSTLAASMFLDKKPNSKNYANVYGFLRYLRDGESLNVLSDDRFNVFDIGIKAELEFQKLVFGYEYINRSGDADGYRSAGNVKYQILKDIYITGTFGNNFGDNDDLITLFGVQWGINHPFQSVNVNSGTQ